jgi:hypothetical protein
MSLLELNSDRKGVLFVFVYVLDNNYSVCYTKLATLFVMHMLVEDNM